MKASNCPIAKQIEILSLKNCPCFWRFINTTAYHMGRYEHSCFSPSDTLFWPVVDVIKLISPKLRNQKYVMMSETALKYEKCHFKQNYNLKLFSLLFYNINYRSGGNQSKGKNLNQNTSPKKSSMDYFTNKQKACFIIRPIIF